MEPILILSNLPPSANSENLLAMLPKPGTLVGGVIRAEVVSTDLTASGGGGSADDDALSSGSIEESRYGFIAFELDADADSAAEQFDGLVVDGHKIKCLRQTLGELEVHMAQSAAAGKVDAALHPAQQHHHHSRKPQHGMDDAAAAAAAAAPGSAGSEGSNKNDHMTLTPQQQQRGHAAATSAAQKVGLHGALRYPFAPMHLGWLQEYVAGLDPDGGEQLVAMCRVLECLMGNAVSTCDPFLEHAVVNFYTKFQPAVWGRVQNQQSASLGSAVGGLTFELSRQVFEVIGLIRRFPGATAKSRKMLLTLVERVLDDVVRVTKDSPSMQHVRDIPEVVKNVHESVAKLRVLHLAQQTSVEAEQQLEKSRTEKKIKKENEDAAAAASAALDNDNDDDKSKGKNDSESDQKKEEKKKGEEAEQEEEEEEERQDISKLIPPAPTSLELDEALAHLTSWLRYLFFALSSTKPILVPACPPPPPGVQVVLPCSESCACFERLQRSPAVHIADVEKVKVIDGLLVSGFGAPAEEEMAAFARELLGRYSIDFCARAVSQVQNGQFAITRFHMFEALRLARRCQAVGTVGGIVEDWRSLDLIDLALQHTAATCSEVPELAAVVNTLVPNAQACLTRVRAARASLLLKRYHQQKQQEEERNRQLSGQAARNKNNNNNNSDAASAGFTNEALPSSPAAPDLFALQKYTADIFKMLCNQQFLLCVHYVPYDAEVAAAQALEKQKKEEEAAAAAAAAAAERVDRENDTSAATTETAPPPPSAATQPSLPKPPPGPPKCANPPCGTVKGELLKCSACKITWYCSRACQQADWKTHKAFCKATAAERAQQQQQQQQAGSPTAAAAQWLFERCEKSIAPPSSNSNNTKGRICEIRAFV